MKEIIQVNGHSIEVVVSIWNGKESVSYDGNIVSSRRNLSTFSSIHSFKVEEAGESVVYEVQILSGILTAGYALRRNGIIQAHKP